MVKNLSGKKASDQLVLIKAQFNWKELSVGLLCRRGKGNTIMFVYADSG